MAHLIHSVLPSPQRKIVSISPDESVKKCLQLMNEHNIGALVVMDEHNKVLGIVSERDIIRSSLKPGFNLDDTKVADVFCKEVSILHPHDHVEKAMQAITSTKRRHVLIYEKDQLIAILSIGDLLFHLLEDKARVIEHLEHYIHT